MNLKKLIMDNAVLGAIIVLIMPSMYLLGDRFMQLVKVQDWIQGGNYFITCMLFLSLIAVTYRKRLFIVERQQSFMHVLLNSLAESAILESMLLLSMSLFLKFVQNESVFDYRYILWLYSFIWFFILSSGVSISYYLRREETANGRPKELAQKE